MIGSPIPPVREITLTWVAFGLRVAEEAEKQPSSTEAASTEAAPEIVRRRVPQIEIRHLEKMLTRDEANEILSGIVIKKVVVAEKKDQSQSESGSEGSAD